jgi:hypothetical protein
MEVNNELDTPAALFAVTIGEDWDRPQNRSEYGNENIKLAN